MDDLISRQKAIDAPEEFIKDCNPEHFVGHQKFIEFMDNAEIGSFGNWQFANGFNLGLTAAEVAIKKLPSAQGYADADYIEKLSELRFDTGFQMGKASAQQWIPVSVSSPPKDGEWAIFTDGRRMSIERYKADTIDHFFPSGRWFDLEDAVAWMPLPEPYQEGENQ